MPKDKPKGLEVTLKLGEDEVTIQPDPHVFKSSTSGWYFRNRVLIGGESYHVQLIVSKK